MDDFGETARPERDWADSLDDTFSELGRERHRERARAQQRQRRVRYFAGAGAGLASVIGVVWALAARGPTDEPDIVQALPDTSSASPTASSTPTGPSLAARECPSEVRNGVVRGADRGDGISGAGAILAFEAAYYLDRSGVKARSATTPDAAVPTAEQIQQGIDSVPRGTSHCVLITENGPHTYAVELTETRPDTGTVIYRQTITTAQRDGRILITGINAR